MLTVHFVGMPPGTATNLLKCVPPETIEGVGGPELRTVRVVSFSAVDVRHDRRHA